jgi:uncharacterized protein
MEFPVSGVEVSPIVPVLVGFIIAATTSPVGVSGAFLLLPFQFSVLGFTAPGVTPTNLVYNVLATPAGILRYRRQGAFDRELVVAIARGAIPAIVVGSLLRVTVFEDPGDFKMIVGLVLFGLGVNLVIQSTGRKAATPERASTFDPVLVSLLGAGAGVIGGIYGVSGGSIVAPVLVGAFRLPVTRVAPAALAATLLTSLAGVISFEVLAAIQGADDLSRRPDYLLALLFGIGGAVGAYTGARLNARLPDRWLRVLLGALAIGLALSYVLGS